MAVALLTAETDGFWVMYEMEAGRLEVNKLYFTKQKANLEFTN